MSSSLPDGAPISGILYFHRISNRTSKSTDTAVRNLEKFCEGCDFSKSDFARRVLFVTTMWDEVALSEGSQSLEVLRSNWASILEKGAQVCQITGEESTSGKDSAVGAIPTTESVEEVVRAVVKIDSSAPLLWINPPHKITIQSGNIVILYVCSSFSRNNLITLVQDHWSLWVWKELRE